MIPLWISIPCEIITLIIICRWFLSLDIDWKEAFKNTKEIVINMIAITCLIVSFIATLQWLIIYGLTK